MRTGTNYDAKKLAMDAVLCAMVSVLGFFAITTNAVKLSFESLPILFAAFAFGAVDGAVVGGMGTLIYQMLMYGFSATTALWILPYIAAGLFCGFFAKRMDRDELRPSGAKVYAISIASELIITLFNTLAIFADSKIYGYYFPGLIAGALLLRLGIAVLEGVAFGFIIPVLLKRVKV